MSEDNKLSLNVEGAFVTIAIIGTEWKGYISWGHQHALAMGQMAQTADMYFSVLETRRSRIKMPRKEGSYTDCLTSSVCGYVGEGGGSSYKDVAFVVPGACFMTLCHCSDPHRGFVSKHSCIGS